MRLKPQTYALTAVCHQRRRIFQRTANAELLVHTLLRYRDQGQVPGLKPASFDGAVVPGLKPRPISEATAPFYVGEAFFVCRWTSPLPPEFRRLPTKAVAVAREPLPPTTNAVAVASEIGPGFGRTFRTRNHVGL